MLLAVCDTMASRRGLRWPPGRWWLPAALAVLAWTSPAGAFAPLNATNIHEDSVPFADSRAALLGDIVTPTFYVVKIEPDYQYPLQSTTDFKGSVTIDFALSSSTRQIDLIASRDITFVSVSLRRDMEASVTIYSRTRPSDNTDVYRITTLYNMVATSTLQLAVSAFEAQRALPGVLGELGRLLEGARERTARATEAGAWLGGRFPARGGAPLSKHSDAIKRTARLIVPQM